MDQLKEAIQGSLKGLPQCQLVALQTVANQIIDDMEDKELVPNRCTAGCHPMILYHVQSS